MPMLPLWGGKHFPIILENSVQKHDPKTSGCLLQNCKMLPEHAMLASGNWNWTPKKKT